MAKNVSMPNWLVVFLVIVTAGFSFMVGQHFSVLPANTATQTGQQFGWFAGSGICGGGQNPAVTGEGGTTLQGFPSSYKIGEIFSQDKYYISWNAVGGVSEAVSVAGTVFQCHAQDASPYGQDHPTGTYQYSFTIDNGNGTFVPFLNPATPQGIFQSSQGSSCFTGSGPGGTSVCDLQSFPFKINGFQFTSGSAQVGIIDGATLHVDLRVQNGAGGWFVIASDQAVLRSGIVNGYWSSSLYHVNDTATFYWQVPTVTIDGTTAYFLTITNDNTGSPVGQYNYMPINTTFGSVSFTISPSWFSPGGVNQLHAIISSAILNAKSVPVSMRFGTSNGPVVTNVSFNQAYYHQGDTVYVTWSATPDPATHKPILRYRVEADILGLAVFTPQFVNATNVSFSAASTGPLDVFVTAYDVYGPGAVYHATSTVGNPVDICRIFPDLPQCGSDNGGSVSANAVTVYLVVIAIGFILYIVSRAVPNPVMRIALIVAGLVLILVGVFLVTPLLIKALSLYIKGVANPFG